MAQYRIVCTTQEPAWEPSYHAHIVKVGTGRTHGEPTLIWTLREVIDAIENGWHTFHTVGPRTGIRARVEVAYCSSCSGFKKIIKTVGDVTTDNNLDSLPRC